MFSFEFTRNVWLEEKAAKEEKGYHRDVNDDDDEGVHAYDLDYDLGDFFISQRETSAERNSCDNFLEDGKTNADKSFFCGLTSQFKLEDLSRKFKPLYIIWIADVVK